MERAGLIADRHPSNMQAFERGDDVPGRAESGMARAPAKEEKAARTGPTKRGRRGKEGLRDCIAGGLCKPIVEVTARREGDSSHALASVARFTAVVVR